MNINKKNVDFIAKYDYGESSEQIKKEGVLTSIFKKIVVKSLEFFIFPGASFLKSRFIDNSRSEKAENQLHSIGGESIKMKTPDGDVINGLYIDNKKFKEKINEFFILHETKNIDGTVNQFLVIKEKHCVLEEKKVHTLGTFEYLRPNEEALKFIHLLDELKMPAKQYGEIPNSSGKRGYIIPLGILSNNIKNESEGESSPTALISHGSASTYAAYKGLAISYLLKGLNVMLIDLRGYGKSEGTPTDHKTKLDFETAYQYLSSEKKLKNSDLLVHGYCLSGGPASDLSARREGVNVILDRTFADFVDVAKNNYKKIEKILQKLLPYIINYNNVENIKKTRGNVAIVRAVNDNEIPEDQFLKLVENLPNSEKGQTMKLIHSEAEHTGLWTGEEMAALQFNNFLEKSNLTRKW